MYISKALIYLSFLNLFEYNKGQINIKGAGLIRESYAAIIYLAYGSHLNFSNSLSRSMLYAGLCCKKYDRDASRKMERLYVKFCFISWTSFIR